MKQKGFTVAELLIVVTVICALLFVVFSLFSEEGEGSAISAAEASGFQNVKVLETYRWAFAHFHGCSDRDWKATIVTATNPLGKNVTLTVCEGFWFKGATIRH